MFKGAGYSRVDYYLGMIRLMDQDTTAMKVIAVLLTDPKRRGHHTPWGTAWGRTAVVRSREREGKLGKSLQCGLHLKETFMGELFTISRG